ncbi:MAG TPA: cysteine--tRNA ligase [Kofleriaceae bacterium]|nr:cysteine--tRNA ligase [Kofleriaceae bacterium]
MTPVPLRLYDSFRKQKVPFEPVVPGRASIYLCGPTTYDSAHIGHAYSAICFDVIRRSLTWLGYQVTFVRNVTDVDDKIIARASERGEPALELAARYADEYNRDMAAFGVLPPDIEPRVSTHIPDIVALIERLVAAGKAYAVDGDVYFSVETFPPYGRLSGQSIDDLRSGARVEVDERKRSPVDFALWKSAKPGEPSWESPWGPGRPGWHIECSAMVARHLGEVFDIHGGGKDLVFPHHENEIAQSQGAFGEGTFARYWMHNGFLNFSGEKMSKSLGNVLSCPQIVEACGPEAMRMFVVSHHYRSPVNFEVASEDGRVVFRDLEAADRRLDYFYSTLRRIDDFLASGGDGGEGEVVPEAEALVPAAREGLADDFNTPVVVAALGEAARAANKLLDEGKGMNKAVRRRSLARLGRDLRSVGGALGVLFDEPAEFLARRRARLAARRGVDAAEVERLLEARAEARKARDFARADEIRGELQRRGVEVLDTPSGADWRIAE